MNAFAQFFSRRLGRWRSRNYPGAYIVSYPKSGRTWLRLMFGHLVCSRFEMNQSLMLHTRRLTRRAGMIQTTFTHDGSSIRHSNRWDQLSGSKEEYRDAKVVVQIRDPRDTMVSSYFYATKRRSVFQGPIADFLRSDKFGAKKVIKFYADWYWNRQVPKDFLLVRYEEMHTEASSVLRSVIQFLEIPSVADSMIREAVEFAQFENMRKMEATGQFQKHTLRPGDLNNTDTYKTRRGKVGGFKEHLSPEDCDFVAALVKEAQCPVFDSYGVC